MHTQASIVIIFATALSPNVAHSPGQACCLTDAALARSAAKHWLVVPLMQHMQKAVGSGFWAMGISGTRGCVAQKWQPGDVGPLGLCLDQQNGVPAQ